MAHCRNSPRLPIRTPGGGGGEAVRRGRERAQHRGAGQAEDHGAPVPEPNQTPGGGGERPGDGAGRGLSTGRRALGTRSTDP